VAPEGTRVAETGAFSRISQAKVAAKISGVAPEWKAIFVNY
jgi:hypothetical protein